MGQLFIVVNILTSIIITETNQLNIKEIERYKDVFPSIDHYKLAIKGNQSNF